MTRLDLLNRVITAAALVALAVTLGVWLTRSPLTAAPAATTPPTVAPLPSPVKSIRPAKTLREPTLAPLPPPAPVTPTRSRPKCKSKWRSPRSQSRPPRS